MIDCNKCPKEKERFQYGIDEDPFFIRAHQLKLCFTCALDHLIESEQTCASFNEEYQKQRRYSAKLSSQVDAMRDSELNRAEKDGREINRLNKIIGELSSDKIALMDENIVDTMIYGGTVSNLKKENDRLRKELADIDQLFEQCIRSRLKCLTE